MLNIDIRSKRFPGRTPDSEHIALENLRFSVPERQFVCLVGPSGCGKSTLVHIVNGLDRNLDGTVRLDGRVTTAGIGTMFQTPRLMPWMSVLDNVMLVMDGDPTDRERAMDLLAAMELAEVMHAYPNRLSGGMQRRVALARAFAIRPRVLLLDEPFVSLDAPVANRLRSMLIELWQEHATTVLFVTHDLREALALSDRVVFLSAAPGRMVLDFRNPLPRPRLPDDAAVAELHDELLLGYPGLLAGRIDKACTGERVSPLRGVRSSTMLHA